MINKKINNYKELQLALDELNISKVKQEELLKANVKGLQDALNPLNMLKSYLKKAAGDNELHQDVLKAGIGIGSRFVIEKLLGSNKSVKRHVAATVFEKVIEKFVK